MTFGYKLIHIWESDWINNKEQILKMLKNNIEILS